MNCYVMKENFILLLKSNVSGFKKYIYKISPLSLSISKDEDFFKFSIIIFLLNMIENLNDNNLNTSLFQL